MPLLDVDVRVRTGEDRAGEDLEVRWVPAAAPPVPWAALVTIAAVTAGVVLRFVAPSALWLDEAQSVAIAQLAPPELVEALRSDGAPPLWYLLLHAWMQVAGVDAFAVRLLPMLLSVASLALAWRVGTIVGGRPVAVGFTVLLATSPFAIRYASEARMYALLLVLVLLGLVLVLDRSRLPTRTRAVLVAGVTGALLLTHYWAALLVATAAVALIADGVAHPSRRRHTRRLLASMAAGGVLFLPWLPSFLHQLERTGAPWGRPPGASVIESTVRGFAGGGDAGSLLGVLLLLAAGAATALPFLDGRSRRRLPGVLIATSLLTLLLGAASLEISGDGFAPRHATVVLAPLLLAVATATVELRPLPAKALVGLMAGLGLLAAFQGAGVERTQAPAIAAVLRDQVRPGDVVAACPDQLTPALARLLEPGSLPTRVLPPGSPAGRVDWTAYAARARASDPAAFAQALHAEAGAGTVWLVSSPNYVGVGRRCLAVERTLRQLRPAMSPAVRLRPTVFENAALWRAPAPSGSPPGALETP